MGIGSGSVQSVHLITLKQVMNGEPSAAIFNPFVEALVFVDCG